MLHRRRMPALLLLLSPLCLPACGAVQAVATLVPREPLPASTWRCQDQPPPLDGDFDDAAFAGWVADVAAAGQDCRDKLGTAKFIEEGP